MRIQWTLVGQDQADGTTCTGHLANAGGTGVPPPPAHHEHHPSRATTQKQQGHHTISTSHE